MRALNTRFAQRLLAVKGKARGGASDLFITNGGLRSVKSFGSSSRFAKSRSAPTTNKQQHPKSGVLRQNLNLLSSPSWSAKAEAANPPRRGSCHEVDALRPKSELAKSVMSRAPGTGTPVQVIVSDRRTSESMVAERYEVQEGERQHYLPSSPYMHAWLPCCDYRAEALSTARWH